MIILISQFLHIFHFFPLDNSSRSGKLEDIMAQYLFVKQLKKLSPLTTRVRGLAAV